MDVTKKVPVREQAPDVEIRILMKFVWVTTKKKLYQKPADVLIVRMHSVLRDALYPLISRHLFMKLKKRILKLLIRLSVSHQHFQLSADVYVHRKASVKENVSAVSRAKQFLLVSWNVSLLTGQGKIRLSRKNLRKRRIRKLPLLVQVLQVLPVQEILQRWVMT